MSDTASNNSFTIQCTRAGRNGQTKWVARLGDRVVATEEFKHTWTKKRGEFAHEVANDADVQAARITYGEVIKLVNAKACEIEAAGGAPPEPECDGNVEDHQTSRRQKSEKKQATTLIALAIEDSEYFHDATGKSYATVPVADHHETYLLKSVSFRRWLSWRYYRVENKTPNETAFAEAIATLDGKAVHAGAERQVHVRMAQRDDAFFLDLGQKEWQAVQISSGGWEIVPNPPVKFRRPSGMLALPTPKRGGSVDILREFLNIDGPGLWPLILAWLIAAFRPRGPYPILALHGEQGSAKTTTARMLRSCIDPHKVMLRSPPRDERDLAIHGSNAWVLGFDNLSYIREWLSNGMCCIATGGGFGTRTLYTDEDETLFDFQRPQIITGIEEVASRGDLIERSIILTLPSIPKSKRRTEREMLPKFEETCPLILGALLDAVAAGMKNLPGVVLDDMPRMADFAEWAVACEQALGLSSGTFLAAYTENAQTSNALTIESSAVGIAIVSFMDSGESWTGTVKELLTALEAQLEEKARNRKFWPGSPKALAGDLRRLAPSLRDVGINVTIGKRTRKGTPVTLQRVCNQSSQSSHRSQEAENHEKDGGFGGEEFGDRWPEQCSRTCSPEETERAGEYVGGDGQARRSRQCSPEKPPVFPKETGASERREHGEHRAQASSGRGSKRV